MQPGDYAIEWFLGDRVMPGELSLQPNRPPEVAIFGDLVPKDPSRGRRFPEDHTFHRVAGRLRSGRDAILTDANLSTWPMQRTLGSARHAVVGLNVAGVPSCAFHRARFQITNLDLLFGVPPIHSVTLPAQGGLPLDSKFAIETNPAAHHQWVEDSAGLTIEGTYDIQLALSNGYQHYVAFAPVISIASDEPLTVDRWVHDWVIPLLRLAMLATRQPQRLSWLTVNTAPRSSSATEVLRSTTGTVFGLGIDQAPYEAEYRAEWRECENRPLFTLATIPMSLTVLARNWRTLELDNDPFMELFGLALGQTELPGRARYLYLMQALEALHAYEHRAEDEEAQTAFEHRRSEVLDALAEAELLPGDLSFIKDRWSKRRPDSLDRRLRELIDQLPEAVRVLLSDPPSGDALRAMNADRPQPLETLLRILRNDLSHGNRNYDEHSLRPWVTLVETVCRAHALRLLGFDDGAIATGLAPPSAPPVVGGDDHSDR